MAPSCSGDDCKRPSRDYDDDFPEAINGFFFLYISSFSYFGVDFGRGLLLVLGRLHRMEGYDIQKGVQRVDKHLAEKER